MKFFVDTNVILDVFLGRDPFEEAAIQVFEKIELDGWELFTSDNAITTPFFYLKKQIGSKKAKTVIIDFLQEMKIQPVGRLQLLSAAQSNFKDFEDAVQYQCALSIVGIDGIITRNKKDFKNAHIPVYTPFEALEL